MILLAKSATDNFDNGAPENRIEAAYDLGYLHGVHAARDAIDQGPSAQAARRWRERFERRRKLKGARP